MTITKLDLAGLKCPLPVLRTRKALRGLKPDDVLQVVCTDPLAIIDIPLLVEQSGDTIKSVVHDALTISFHIIKSKSPTECGDASSSV